MDNNQNNFNDSPQINNQNQTQLNVIPQMEQVNNTQEDNHQFDQDFIKVTETDVNNNQASNQNTFINNPINSIGNNTINNRQIDNFEAENPMLNLNKNKFITNNTEVSDTSLNTMNVDGEYNNMPKVDYSQDPKVQENLKQIKNNNNTITIGSEGKVFIVIIVVLLLFVFVMPFIFDVIRDITQ